MSGKASPDAKREEAGADLARSVDAFARTLEQQDTGWSKGCAELLRKLHAEVERLTELDEHATEYTFRTTGTYPDDLYWAPFQAINGSWDKDGEWFVHDVNRALDLESHLTKDNAIERARELAHNAIRKGSLR